MNALVLPTSRTPTEAADEIRRGLRPRIDYLDLRERLEQAGISVDVVDFSVYDRMPWKTLEKPDRLSRMAWGQALFALRHWRNYDVVYSLGEDVGVPLALLLRLVGKRPRHILVAHNVLAARKRPLLRGLGVLHRFDVILALSAEAARATAAAYGLAPERLHFSPHTVDGCFWQPQPCAEAQTGPPLVLSVGAAKRDPATLFAAIAGLPVRLRVQAATQWSIAYGTGQGQTALPINVEWGERVSFIELRALYAQAAFCVIALQPGAHHSAGTNAICEAMAMGKAVVVAGGEGLEGYVVHGETGLLTPAGDAAALRAAIAALLADPTRTQAMGQRGRARLETLLDYDERIDGLARLAAT